MVVASLSGNIEPLFTGWELVGLSSALLVAYFQERAAPARNGLWVWTVYRVSDAALLLAAVVMHHMTGQGDFDQLLGVARSSPWPEGHVSVEGAPLLAVGLLLLLAAAGKPRWRTLELVRAPSLLQDSHTLENAIGQRLQAAAPWDSLASGGFRAWLYRLSLERGYLDAFLADYVVGPFCRVFRWCDSLER